MASRLLVDVAAREERKDSGSVWLSGLFLRQRGTCIGLLETGLNPLQGVRFARHKDLDCEFWAQLLEAHFEHHEGEACGRSARWDLLGGVWETHAMEIFKLNW